jgi:hypothetical protein
VVEVHSEIHYVRLGEGWEEVVVRNVHITLHTPQNHYVPRHKNNRYINSYIRGVA